MLSLIIFVSIVAFLTHLVLPVVFLIWVAFNKGKNRIYKLFVILFVTIFLFLMKLGGAGWHWFGVWWPFLFVVLLIPSYFFSLRNFKTLAWLPPKKFFPWLNISTLFIFSAFLLISLMQFITLHKYKGTSIKLKFPLSDGVYYVVHGGNSIAGNHHHPIAAQKYAVDIVKINVLGIRAKGLIPSKLTAYNIFEDKLFAPCSGEVISVENHMDDNKIFQTNPKKPIGNHVILYCKGHSVVMAHLKKNSVNATVGDDIQEGDFIGQVGNSGNTSEPHLHIHAVKGKATTKEIIQDGLGIPMVFDNKFLVRGDQFRSFRKE